MTPDGRYVAFTSAATNLVAGDTNGIADVFVRDLQAGTTTLVSVGAVIQFKLPLTHRHQFRIAGNHTGWPLRCILQHRHQSGSRGRRLRVKFMSATWLPGNTIWASTNARAIFQSVTGGTNAASCNYSISDDGQFVAFEVCTNPASGAPCAASFCVTHVSTGLTDIIATNASVQLRFLRTHPQFGHDARRPVRRVCGESATFRDQHAIYLWDAQTGTNTLVSVRLEQSATPASGVCDSPVISANGQFVAFISTGTNLVTNPLDRQFHVYFRDLQAGVTQLLDADTNGIRRGRGCDDRSRHERGWQRGGV